VPTYRDELLADLSLDGFNTALKVLGLMRTPVDVKRALGVVVAVLAVILLVRVFLDNIVDAVAGLSVMLVVLECMRVVAAQAPQRDVAVAVGWGHHEGGSRMRVPKTCLR
jgi:hypothetical protein